MNNNNQLNRGSCMPNTLTGWLTPRALLLWLCAATVAGAPGCTAMHTIEAPAAQESWAGIEAGDKVVLSLRDGRQLELDLVEWTGQALIGRDASGARLTVEPADIQSAKIERFSAGRSALLGVAIVSAGFAAAAIDVGKDLADSLAR